MFWYRGDTPTTAWWFFFYYCVCHPIVKSEQQMVRRRSNCIEWRCGFCFLVWRDTCLWKLLNFNFCGQSTFDLYTLLLGFFCPALQWSLWNQWTFMIMFDSFSHLVTCFFSSFFFLPFWNGRKKKSAGCTTGEIFVQADRVRLETLRLCGTNLVWNLWQWFWCYFQQVLGTTSIWCLISKAFQNWWVILVLTLLWQDNLCLSDLFSWKDWVKYIQELVWHLGIVTVNWDCRNSWLVNHPPPNVPPPQK